MAMSPEDPRVPSPEPAQPTPAPRSRTPWVIGGIAAVLLVVAVVVAFILINRGDAGTPTTAGTVGSTPAGAISSNAGEIMSYQGGVVENAQSYLQQLDQTFQSGLASLDSTQARASDGARCYYVVDAAGGFSGVAVCGPVRRMGSEPGQVWDRLTIDVVHRPEPSAQSSVSGPDPYAVDTASPRDSAGWKLDEVVTNEVSSARPIGALYRPDGATPAADADDLGLPDLPRARTDMFQDFSYADAIIDTDVKPDPDKAVLVSPGATVSLSRVVTLPQITDPDGRAVQPAEGYRFLAFTVDAGWAWPDPEAGVAAGEQGNSYTSIDPPQTTVTFVADGQTKDITEKLKSGQVTLLTTVPVDAKPELVVSASGHEQTMDILTATRVDDPLAAPFYQQDRVTVLNRTMPVLTKTNTVSEYGDSTATYRATVESATISAYDPVLGWAPEGQVWVEIKASDDADDDDFDSANDPVPSYAGWLLTVDGKQVKAQQENLSAGNSGVFTFAVPATASKVTGSFVTTLTAKTFDQTKIVTMKTKPVTFSVPMS